MRVLVFVLVLANLVLLAYGQRWFGGGVPDPTRAAQQVNPERIRVVSRGAPPVAAGAPAAQLQPSAESCRRWAGLDAEGAKQLGDLAAAPRFAALKVDATRRETSGSWWVYIPPAPSRGDAERKAGQLQRLGVEEFFVVQTTGPTRNAISLGIFSTEQAARDRLVALQAKGVRSAVVGARNAGGERHVLEVRGSEADLDALAAAAAALPVKPADCGEGGR